MKIVEVTTIELSRTDLEQVLVEFLQEKYPEMFTLKSLKPVQVLFDIQSSDGDEDDLDATEINEKYDVAGAMIVLAPVDEATADKVDTAV